MTCIQKYIYCGYTLKINYLVLIKHSPYRPGPSCTCIPCIPRRYVTGFSDIFVESLMEE